MSVSPSASPSSPLISPRCQPTAISASKRASSPRGRPSSSRQVRAWKAAAYRGRAASVPSSRGRSPTRRREGGVAGSVRALSARCGEYLSANSQSSRGTTSSPERVLSRTLCQARPVATHRTASGRKRRSIPLRRSRAGSRVRFLRQKARRNRAYSGRKIAPPSAYMASGMSMGKNSRQQSAVPSASSGGSSRGRNLAAKVGGKCARAASNQPQADGMARMMTTAAGRKNAGGRTFISGKRPPRISGRGRKLTTAAVVR